MRWLLLSAVLLVVPARAEEGASPAPAVREKLRARILETLPPAPAASSAEPRPEPAGEPVLELEPMVVTESRGVRELSKALAADKQRQAAESFSPVRGGKIYGSERLDLGGWWSPATGWHFLRLKW
jgi:hypothetical protein